METAIIKLVEVFHTHAGKDNHLGKNEFQKLVQTGLPNFITSTENKRAVNELRNKFDKNKDGKITFEEYFGLITELATNKHKQL